MLFKTLTVITALLSVSAIAAPSHEKRQFGIPPSDCKDIQTWENCVSGNPAYCLGPNPAGQLAW